MYLGLFEHENGQCQVCSLLVNRSTQTTYENTTLRDVILKLTFAQRYRRSVNVRCDIDFSSIVLKFLDIIYQRLKHHAMWVFFMILALIIRKL